MIYIDANVLLRYLLRDDETLAKEAKTIIENESCFAPNAVIAEVVYVLTKVYSLSRSDVSRACSLLLEKISVESDAVMQTAFSEFAETSLDFVDYLLYAYHKVIGVEVFSFDKKLQNKLRK